MSSYLMGSIVHLLLVAVWVSLVYADIGDNSKDEVSSLERVFINSDLVVDGSIEKITTIKVPHDEFLPDKPGPDIPVALVLLKINRVLIGTPQPEPIEVCAIISKTDHNYFEMVEGERYILALRYDGAKKGFFRNKYISRENHERFLIQGSRWLQGRKDKPLRQGDLNILIEAINNAAHERSLEVLKSRADLVVRGRVAENLSDSSDAEKRPGIERVLFAIESFIKGDIDSDSLIISLQTQYSLSRPSLGVLVPEMMEGEEWIVFLKHLEGREYIPSAGVNGMFLIKDGSVIRNNWNEILLNKSVDEFERNLKLLDPVKE